MRSHPATSISGLDLCLVWRGSKDLASSANELAACGHENPMEPSMTDKKSFVAVARCGDK